MVIAPANGGRRLRNSCRQRDFTHRVVSKFINKDRDNTMKKSALWPIVCSALVFGTVSAARAGAYGETVEAEEAPNAAPPSAMVSVDEDEGWTFVITPQLWAPHIDSGGFAGNSSLDPATTLIQGEGVSDARFDGRNHEAVDSLDLQWGFQLAAKKGRWAVGLSYQSSDFETRTDMIYEGESFTLLAPNGNVLGSIEKGERGAQEFVNTSRTDVDLAASYTFPDVVPNRLDIAVGLGLKMIYADSVREYSNLSPLVAQINAAFPPGLYRICKGDNRCDDGTRESFDQRVKSTTWMYGATIPLTAVVHLTEDAKWLLPISVAPFIGAETRDDNDVVYKVIYSPTGDPVRVDRQDGTYFAYGVTADAKLSWGLSDSLSAYLGMRVQYMNGDSPNSDAYLAYGPLLGISASFRTGGA